MGMRRAMVTVTYRRRHVDDSFNKFSFLEVRHRFIAPFKLIACQPIAVLQRWHTALACHMRLAVVDETAIVSPSRGLAWLRAYPLTRLCLPFSRSAW